MKRINVTRERRAYRSTAGRTGLLIFSMLFLSIVGGAGLSRAQDLSAQYTRTDLVSSGYVWTPNTDSSLVAPRGIARSSDGPWWVADEGKGRATLYTGEGISYPGLAPLVIGIPENPGDITDDSSPTSIVYNGTSDFELAPGAPGRFIIVTRHGTVAGWNGEPYRREAVLVVDNSPDAGYTGAAIAQRRGENTLYVANFRQGRIDAFGPDFSPVLLVPGAFADPFIPEGFSPYNVQNINGNLFVTFAKARVADDGVGAGEGLGYVDVFDADGILIMRLEPGPWMNAPWGIAVAHDGFGAYSRQLLVANCGSGQIASFDEESGTFSGFLQNSQGTALTIPGLHALGFGNNGIAGPETTLFFSAGFRESKPNIFGAITPLSEQEAPPVAPQPSPNTTY